MTIDRLFRVPSAWDHHGSFRDLRLPSRLLSEGTQKLPLFSSPYPGSIPDHAPYQADSKQYVSSRPDSHPKMQQRAAACNKMLAVFRSAPLQK